MYAINNSQPYAAFIMFFFYFLMWSELSTIMYLVNSVIYGKCDLINTQTSCMVR